MRTLSNGDGGVVAALHDARATERLGSYLRQLWSRRDWAWYVAGSDLRTRQINSVLGNLWHLLNPILQISVYFLIFGLVLEISRGVDNFVGFLAVGTFVYSFSQKSVMAGGKSLIKYRGLIQIVTFPRALVPITTTLTEALAIVPAYAVMVVVLVATGEPPGVEWLAIVPVFVVQAVFNGGLAMVAARAVSRVVDIQQVLPFVFRLGFYASGVLFNVNAYLGDSPWRRVFELNPFYCFIEINRGMLLDGYGLRPHLFGIAAAWTVAAALLGFVWFRAAEDTYGDQ